jgi:hypothetical protein
MERMAARACITAVGLAIIVIAGAVPVYAGNITAPGAPEIDGTSILAGLGLLGASVAVFRARRRSK